MLFLIRNTEFKISVRRWEKCGINGRPMVAPTKHKSTHYIGEGLPSV